MKGVVFTELLSFAEQEIGPAEVEAIVAGGSYDATGSYDHGEILTVVARLAAAADVLPDELLRRFGAHLFHRFADLYPVFLVGTDSALEFLGSIESHIHGELRQLYPDAEFPGFECQRGANGELTMVYRSGRCLADLAEGLIRGCAEHFGEPIDLVREELPSADGQAVCFSLIRHES
jgi:hypothetical protein